MSEFFEASDLVVPKPRPTRSPWFGPPRGTLPGVVALDRVLARTDKVAVCASHMDAYPNGFVVEVVVFTDHPFQDTIDPLLEQALAYPSLPGSPEAIPPGFLRLGIEFADGRRATNTDAAHTLESPPAQPSLQETGGHGGAAVLSSSTWIWGLPPLGALNLVCQWPAAGIPVTRTELDAQLVLDTAARAQTVFAENPRPAGSE